MPLLNLMILLINQILIIANNLILKLHLLN